MDYLRLLENHPEATLINLLSVVVGVAVVVLLLWKTSRSGEESKLPPGPPKLPIIGNIHQLGKNPHISLTQLSRIFGPIIHLQLGHIPVVVISSASTAKEVLKTHDLAIANRPLLYSAKYLFYGWTDMGFSPYGPYWRQVRKICNLELLSAARVKSFGGQRDEEVDTLLRRIVIASRSGTVNLTKMIALFANTIVCRTAFGKDFVTGGHYDKHNFPKMLKEHLVLVGGFSWGDFFPSLEWMNTFTGFKRRLLDTSRRIDCLLDEIIQEHVDKRKNTNGDGTEVKDLVDVLLDLKMNGGLDIPLTLDNIKAIILDMFTGGTDPTFVTLEWGMTELMKNPRVMKRAQDEIRRIVGDRGKVTEDDVQQMDYLKAVIKENFRLHPAGPLLLPRESREEIIIGRYTIPSKTRFYLNAWAIGRDPETWGRPEEFEPERFVGNAMDFKGQDFELIPFGAGRRMCPGITFAMANVELVLAQLLHSFDWELPEGVKAENLDMSGEFGLTVAKASELVVVAKPRFV